MKIRFVWGLPVLVLPSRDGWGHSLWLIVWMPESPRPTLLPHELWHVRQDIATLFLGPILRRLSRGFRLRCEASAYAESVRHGDSITRCATALASSGYGFGLTKHEAAEKIRAFLESGRLF